MSAPLRAEHAVAFAYRRSVGGATELFLAGLRRGELWASRYGDRVVVPPVDHDPVSGAPVEDFVQLPGTGTVRSWTWVAEPAPDHPLPRPFAFALVQLDGADTALFHVVDVGDERQLSSGLRVRADWRAERTGDIRDLRAFVPGEVPPPVAPAGPAAAGPIEVLSDQRLDYTYAPGLGLSRFLHRLARRRIEGGRCGSCAKVFVPPHPRCPTCGVGPMAPVEVADTGTVVSYTVVHVPPGGSAVEVPFAWAWIRLDGADVPFPHLLGGLDLSALAVGQRVRAVWVADADLAPTWASIRHFGPAAP